MALNDKEIIDNYNKYFALGEYKADMNIKMSNVKYTPKDGVVADFDTLKRIHDEMADIKNQISKDCLTTIYDELKVFSNNIKTEDIQEFMKLAESRFLNYQMQLPFVIDKILEALKRYINSSKAVTEDLIAKLQNILNKMNELSQNILSSGNSDKVNVVGTTFVSSPESSKTESVNNTVGTTYVNSSETSNTASVIKGGSMTIDDVAMQYINGKFGTGKVAEKNISSLGHNYGAVRSRAEEIMNISAKKYERP